MLADYFLSHYAEREGRIKPLLSSDAKEILLSYPWPGNIRELRNICEKIIVLFDADRITGDDIGKILSFDEEEEKESISIGALAASGIIKKGALAKELGVSRTTLWRRLKSKDLKQ